MSAPSEGDGQGPIDRRKFIKVGGLGAAALAAGCVKVAPGPGVAGAPSPVPGQSPAAPVPPPAGQTTHYHDATTIILSHQGD